MSILNNELRNGNFTSSEIVALTTTGKGELGFGEKAITYIAETNIERIMGCCIDSEVDVFATRWGSLMEERVFNMPEIGTDYVLMSDVTHQHPTIDFWVGSTDGIREIKERTVFDFKAPSSKKSFALLTLPLIAGLNGMEAMNALRKGFVYKGVNIPKHKDGEKFYQQLTSNACIHDCNFAELIIYMPYESELLDIINMVGDDPRYFFLKNIAAEKIPCIPDGGPFKNLNVIRWEVPKEDKELLTNCVVKAGTLLIPRTENTITLHDRINGTPIKIVEQWQK